MVKKFFFKDGVNPRRLFKRDLINLHIPNRSIRVVVDSESGLYSCTLFGAKGDVLIMSSSVDKLISVVKDCYRCSFVCRLFNNNFYNSLTFIFVNV